MGFSSGWLRSPGEGLFQRDFRLVCCISAPAPGQNLLARPSRQPDHSHTATRGLANTDAASGPVLSSSYELVLLWALGMQQ